MYSIGFANTLNPTFYSEWNSEQKLLQIMPALDGKIQFCDLQLQNLR